MILKNKYYDNNFGLELISRFYGRRAVSVCRDVNRNSNEIIFYDGMAIRVYDGCFDPAAVFYKHPKSFCTSCGDKHGATIIDFAGRCSVTLEKIWKSARKCYWERENGHG